ncbi:MAG TPA: hypothetical protein VFK56_05255 [Mycobacterium sp.]|nr:hypothetical protein [Mycobacterium sp.]
MPAGKRDRSVSRIRTLSAGVAALAVGAAGSLMTAGMASADPAPPIPIDILQAPGLPAMQQLSPILQQAAANPQKAASMLMAAATAFAGNTGAPADSRQVASSVTDFVQQPSVPGDPSAPSQGLTIKLPNKLNLPGNVNQLLPTPKVSSKPVVTATPLSPAGQPAAAPTAAHEPAAGVVPGSEPHLPTGIDPAHVVGPAPEQALAPAPGAAPDSNPDPVPAAAPAPAPAAAPLVDAAATAPIPKPGPRAGQTAYVFTAIGTPGPAAEQKLPLNVTWVNLTTGRSGSATLKPNPDINPDGPTTLVAIADTGSGSIMSTIFGQVTTVDRQCTFLPTIGSTVVP